MPRRIIGCQGCGCTFGHFLLRTPMGVICRNCYGAMQSGQYHCIDDLQLALVEHHRGRPFDTQNGPNVPENVPGTGEIPSAFSEMRLIGEESSEIRLPDGQIWKDV